MNHVQKLHQQHHLSNTGGSDIEGGSSAGTHSPLTLPGSSSSSPSSSPDSSASKFKAGFSECARLVRDVLQSQVESAGLDQRTSQHLERCLSNLDRVLMMHHPMRSPSPSHSSSSESCSSYDVKDTVLMSPRSQSTVDRNSPVDQLMLWSAKSAFIPSSGIHHRRRSSSSHLETYPVARPLSSYSPDSSPVASYQLSSDGYVGTPSSALNLTAAVSTVEGRNIKWQQQQQRQMVTSPLQQQQQQQQQHSEWQMSDAHVMELRPGGRSSVNVSSLYVPPFTCSKISNTEDAVWRPW